MARQPSPFFSHPPHLGSLFTKLWCLWSPALAFSCITLFALWLPSQPQPLLCHLIYALSPTFPPCSSSLTSNFDMLSGCLSGMCCCPLTLPPPSFLALSPPHLLHSPSLSPHSSLFSLAPPPPSFPHPVTLCHPPPSSPPSLLNQESQQLGIPLPSGWWWHSPHLLPPPPPLTFLLCIPTHLFASLACLPPLRLPPPTLAPPSLSPPSISISLPPLLRISLWSLPYLPCASLSPPHTSLCLLSPLSLPPSACLLPPPSSISISSPLFLHLPASLTTQRLESQVHPWLGIPLPSGWRRPTSLLTSPSPHPSLAPHLLVPPPSSLSSFSLALVPLLSSPSLSLP